MKRDEVRRLQALERAGILDTPPEPDYDDIVRLAAESCGTPIALISLVDRDRQWFKANVGLHGVRETERVISFCTHAIEREGVFLVEDAIADERFSTNPLVQGEPFIRFYAGAPIQTEDGFPIGTLCVIDRRPRGLSESQRRCLMGLKRQLEQMLRVRTQLRQLKARNTELEQAQERMRSLNSFLQAEMRERQRIERQLLDQQELLTSLLTHIPHSVFWKDRNSVYLGCNPQFARDMGMSTPEELIGRTDFELPVLSSMRAEAYRRDDREVMESGIPKLSFEEPIDRLDGELSWVLTSKVPLKDPDGTVKGVVGIYADISERRRQEATMQEAKALIERHAAHLEEQVREAHERTLHLMEHSREAVFVLDEDGRVLKVNPVAERLLGLSREQLLGTSFESLAPEDEREPLRQTLKDLCVRGTVRLEDQGLRSADGGRVALGIAASLQVTGATRCLLIVGEDLTAKRRLEQQSIQNDRLAAMGALAAGIAHEINNPTSYVLSNLAYLQEWRDELERELAAVPGLPPRLGETIAEVKDVLAECLVGGRRIRDIVRDMRFFSHTAGEELTAVDIHSCLDVVLRMAHNELKHTARLERHYAASLPLVSASEGRLSQVFLNLIINAAQAMRSGGPERHVLRVSTAMDGERVRVDISDTGHGIPPEVLPRIFEPFFTTKPAGAGTGLGLSISQSIIQKMGGELGVQSEPGRGTTFSLLLPVS
ncbi:PAS domain-containing protein [Archangium lansingense]|uniref:histidine kinase n=1 Tax=Archangium lansingense TaxID=2995310 RepID=A0ABT4A6R4_9BACT|nr:PAS domain-containing protein [Archangium lansinium]MCY1077343.1 PAS domain-containing protein [Archangium lansinium]